MKKIICGDLLYEKMEEAINILCNTVKTTLGPKGCNAIIDHSAFSPFITNDGVTIAQNIESEDEDINTILELAKEASIKTNEIVGDGTTTTLVLLQQIFNYGLKLIKEGKNPIILKEELDKDAKNIISEIKLESHKPTKKELTSIACTSANSENIGKLVSSAYFKVKNKGAINLIEIDENIIKTEFLNGYTINVSLSPYYLKTVKKLEINSPLIYLIDTLSDLELISEEINFTTKSNETLVIIAKEYDDYVANELLSLYLNEKTNVILLKLEEYGINKEIIFDDLIAITNDTKFAKMRKITISTDLATITFDNNMNTTKRVEKIKKELNDSKIDKSFYYKRLSMFKKGLVNILIGAPTATERREIKMRFEDALCSVDSASQGISLGCGMTFYKISEKLRLNNTSNILIDALKKPFEQIMINSGLDANDIITKIKKENYQVIFNIKNNTFEQIQNTTVFDSTMVLENTLLNAVSIAGMLLTTTSLIINEYQNNLNKINDYNNEL